MGIQEWTIVIGVIVGVSVLFWMASRWRKRRYDDIYSYDVGDNEPEREFGSELPSGGARTVGYRDPTDIERMNQEIRERADTLKPRLSSFASAPREQQALFEETAEPDQDLDEEQIPLLLDPSEEHTESDEIALSQSEISDQSLESGEETKALETFDSEPLSDPLPEEPDSLMQPENAGLPDSAVAKQELADPESAEQQLAEPEFAPKASITPSKEPDVEPKEERFKKEKPVKKKAEKHAAESSSEPSEPAEIIIINLMTTPEAAYEGRPLLRALTELGMRFGEMDIFHYCGLQGDDAPQFRMANLLNPGVFDIDKIDELRTHALCFFYELEPDSDNMSVYESMLSVISKLKDELGGEMRDDQRSVFTIQTSEHCRNRIRDFQRRHLVRKS